MYKCEKCEYESNSVSDLANHYQYKHKENKKMICEKCHKEFKNEKGLKCHTNESCEKHKKIKNHICPKCNLYIRTNIEKHINSCNGLGPRTLIKRREGGQKWSDGKTFLELYGLEKSKELKKNLSDNLIKNPIIISEESEKKRREKISKHAKENGYGGYIKGSGRGKSGWYNGYWCDSSWELAWVIYNLEHDIQFERNTEKFEYFWNNKKYNWIPDFIVNGVYYEIKGFWTEQNESKFEYFKRPLKVLYEKDIKYMIEYVVSKYGKKYIKLYEKGR